MINIERDLGEEQSDRLLSEPKVMTMQTWIGLSLCLISFTAGMVVATLIMGVMR